MPSPATDHGHVSIERGDPETSLVTDVTYRDSPAFNPRKRPFFARRYDTDDLIMDYPLRDYLDRVEATVEYFTIPGRRTLEDRLTQDDEDHGLVDETHRKNIMLGVVYSVASQNNTHRGALREVNKAKRFDLDDLFNPDYLYDRLAGARMDNRGRNRLKGVVNTVKAYGGAEGFRDAYAAAPDMVRRGVARCHGMNYKSATMLATCLDVAKNQLTLDKWLARQCVGLDLDVRVSAGYGKTRDTSGRRIVESLTQSWDASKKGNKTEYTDAESELLSYSERFIADLPGELRENYGFKNDDGSMNGAFLTTFYWLGPKLRNEKRLYQQDMFNNALQGTMYIETRDEALRARHEEFLAEEVTGVTEDEEADADQGRGQLGLWRG